MTRKVLAMALVGLATCALVRTSSAAPSRPEPHLAAAKRHHQALEFERCLDQLAKADPSAATDAERVDVEVYEGLCAFELGQTERADAHFRAALRLSPETTLPPYTSPKIVERFQDLVAHMPHGTPADADAGAHAAPPAPPPSAPLAAPSTSKAALPPPTSRAAPADGASQRSGPPVLTFVLGAGAVAAGVTGGILGLRANTLEGRANGARFESDAYALDDDARAHASAANVAFGMAFVTATAALVVWWLWPEPARR